MRFVQGVQDIQYTEYILLEQLEKCAEYLEKAERYELLGGLYRLIIPMHEWKRSYEALAQCYQTLAQACSKVVEVMHTGKRLLGRYYRVAFFGQVGVAFRTIWHFRVAFFGQVGVAFRTVWHYRVMFSRQADVTLRTVRRYRVAFFGQVCVTCRTVCTWNDLSLGQRHTHSRVLLFWCSVILEEWNPQLHCCENIKTCTPPFVLCRICVLPVVLNESSWDEAGRDESPLLKLLIKSDDCIWFA